MDGWWMDRWVGETGAEIFSGVPRAPRCLKRARLDNLPPLHALKTILCEPHPLRLCSTFCFFTQHIWVSGRMEAVGLHPERNPPGRRIPPGLGRGPVARTPAP